MRAINAFPWQRDRAKRDIKAADVRVGRLFWPCAIAGLIIITLRARWPYLDVPISADEGGYATAAYWWARGDTLYRDITITRPQGIFVVFRLIEALGFGSVRGIHLFAAGYVALATLTLFTLARQLWGRVIAFGAAALFAMAMTTPAVEGYNANAELFMALPLFGSLYLLLRADDHALAGRTSVLLLIGSGLLAALALLIKPAAVVVAPLAAFWLYRRKVADQLPWRNWFVAEGALGLGVALGLAPALIHGLLTVPETYLSAVLYYRLSQDSVVAGAAGYQASYFATNSLYFIGHLPILLVAPFGLWRQWVAGNRRERDFLWLWLLASFCGAALGGNWFLHYYQQLLAPLAVATALGLAALARRSLHPAWLAFQTIAILGGVALGSTLLLPHFRGVDPTQLPEYEPGIAAAGPVAAYVRKHTDPTDTIYVAYDHADIYYLAQRRPAARWLHYRELRWTPGAFEEQVARIANPATAPRYIIGAQAFDRFGFDADGSLRAIIARDYLLETTIGSMPLYRRIDSATSQSASTVLDVVAAAEVTKEQR